MSIKQKIAAQKRWREVSEEEWQRIVAKKAEAMKRAWKDKTPEERRAITAKRLKTLQENRKKRHEND